MEDLITRSRVPKRHLSTVPVAERGAREDPRRAPWSEKLRVVSDAIGGGMLVVLHGPRGTGKTQLACNLIHAACHRELPARYTTAIEFFLHIRTAFGGTTTEQTIVNGYKRPALLVVDELHVRGNTAWEDRLHSSFQNWVPPFWYTMRALKSCKAALLKLLNLLLSFLHNLHIFCQAPALIFDPINISLRVSGLLSSISFNRYLKKRS